MAAVEEIRLGPFVGGLNTFSDPTAIADTEISELLNFELDIDGSLVNRPPIAPIGAAVPGSEGFGIDVLGFFEADGGAKYLIASNRNNSTYYFNGATWILITDKLAASAVVQYRNKAWLVAPIGSATDGGSWSPAQAFAPDANMPKGGCAAAYKDRIFIGPGSNAPSDGARLYLSDLNAVWPATKNFFNVGAGDGQNIVDLAIYSDSIVVFKQGSTYRYAYSNSPANGSTVPISYNIGALTKGCYAAYQNQLFVLFDNKVYEFSSFNYNELNIKVPLKAVNPSAVLAESASISAWSDRVIVEYFDQTYVYSLRTRSWTIWDSNVAPFLGRFWAIPGRQTSEPTAYTYSTAKSGYLGLFIIKDAITSTQEEMLCRVVTKNYDYLNSARFKRLMGWGVDTISKIKIDAYAIPVTYATDITWDRLRNGPGGDGGYAWVSPVTNYAKNPLAVGTVSGGNIPGYASYTPGVGEVGTTLAVTGATDGPVLPGGGMVTSYARRQITTAKTEGSTATGWQAFTTTYRAMDFSGKIGDTVSASIYARYSAPTDPGAAARTVNMRAETYTAAGVSVDVKINTFILPYNQWIRLDATIASSTADFASVGWRIYQTSGAAMPAGSLYDSTAVQLEKGTLSDFVAGGIPDRLGSVPIWLGAANNSLSLGSRYEHRPQGYTWGFLKASGATWDRLIDPAVVVTDQVDTAGSGSGRKYVKFRQSMRFRQIGYRLEATTKGDTLTAPLRIFNLMTYVADKQKVSKKIS